MAQDKKTIVIGDGGVIPLSNKQAHALFTETSRRIEELPNAEKIQEKAQQTQPEEPTVH